MVLPECKYLRCDELASFMKVYTCLIAAWQTAFRRTNTSSGRSTGALKQILLEGERLGSQLNRTHCSTIQASTQSDFPVHQILEQITAG